MTPYYADDLVTLYHGDCREIMAGLDPNMIDVVMADPPFNVPVKYQDNNGVHPRSWGDLAVMEPFFVEAFRAIERVTKPDPHIYICCDADSYPVFYKVAYPLWPQSQLLIWYKPSGRRGRGWLHCHELVLHARTQHTRYAEGWRQDVVGIMPVRTLNRQHPAEKPGELWAFLGESVPKPKPLLLDPFAGSASTLAWARLMGWRAIGVEIEERYCEIAARRLAQQPLPLSTLLPTDDQPAQVTA